MALTLGDVTNGELVLARLHSECSTGDALFSQRYDCGAQLEAALNKITKEGRGIGLVHKIQAYGVQDAGADRVKDERDERDESMNNPFLYFVFVKTKPQKFLIGF